MADYEVGGIARGGLEVGSVLWMYGMFASGVVAFCVVRALGRSAREQPLMPAALSRGAKGRGRGALAVLCALRCSPPALQQETGCAPCAPTHIHTHSRSLALPTLLTRPIHPHTPLPVARRLPPRLPEPAAAAGSRSRSQHILIRTRSPKPSKQTASPRKTAAIGGSFGPCVARPCVRHPSAFPPVHQLQTRRQRWPTQRPARRYS